MKVIMGNIQMSLCMQIKSASIQPNPYACGHILHPTTDPSIELVQLCRGHVPQQGVSFENGLGRVLVIFPSTFQRKIRLVLVGRLSVLSHLDLGLVGVLLKSVGHVERLVQSASSDE